MARRHGLTVKQATKAILDRETLPQSSLDDRWLEALGRNAVQSAEGERLAAQAPYNAVRNVLDELSKLGAYKQGYQALHDGNAIRGHNDVRDAMRHAETSRGLAASIGVVPAHTAGTIRELWETYVGTQPRAEMLMDLRNNAEGRRAAREQRPVDPKRLQIAPSAPAPSNNPYRYR